MGVVFLAVLTQSVSGFGSALVAMAFLPAMIGIQAATPLVALVAISLEALLLVRYHRAMQVRAILPILAASIVGIPLGIYYLRKIDEEIVLGVLGVVIAGYAGYALLKINLPVLRNIAWGLLAGLLAGMLGSAYNTSGPPVIIYGDSQRWKPEEFKANLQGFFIINSLLVVLAHLVGGNITGEVWRLFLWGLPALLVGVLLGTSLDRWISPAVFRKIALWILLVMGLRLILIYFLQ